MEKNKYNLKEYYNGIGADIIFDENGIYSYKFYDGDLAIIRFINSNYYGIRIIKTYGRE